MRSPYYAYRDQLPPASLHSGYERLAIEQALNDLRLQRRGAFFRALRARLRPRTRQALRPSR